jgi:O-antigen/teichoic acid export membrane protein
VSRTEPRTTIAGTAPPAPAPAARDLRTLARGSTLGLVGVVAKGLFGFLLAVVVTRGLGASETGVFFSAVALFTIVTTVAQFGAHTGLVRAVSRQRALDRVVDVRPTLAVALAPVFALAVVLAGVVAVFAPALVGAVMGDDRASGAIGYLRLLALFLPFAAVATTALSATRGLGSVKPYVAVENLAIPLLRPPLVLAAVALGLGGAGVAVTWGVPLVAGAAVALVLLARMVRDAETRATADGAPRASARQLAADFWGFAAPRGVGAIFQAAVAWSDVLIVAALRSPREAGIYGATSRLVMLGTFSLQAVRLAIAPQFSSLLSGGDTARAQTLYQTATWWLMAASWPAYLLLAVFAPVVLQIFGPEFVAGATALRILAVAMLFHLATGNVTTVLLMGGKSAWNLGNTAAALTTNVGLNLVLVPRYGIAGAAVAWAASVLLENALALGQVGWLLRLRPFGRGYPVVALAALGCYGAIGVGVRALLGGSVAALATTVLVGTTAYALLLWRVRAVLGLGVLWEALRRPRGQRGAVRAGAPAGETE